MWAALCIGILFCNLRESPGMQVFKNERQSKERPRKCGIVKMRNQVGKGSWRCGNPLLGLGNKGACKLMAGRQLAR